MERMDPRGSAPTLVVLSVIAATLLIVQPGAPLSAQPADHIDGDAALQSGENPHASLSENGSLIAAIAEDDPRVDAGGIHPNGFSVADALPYATQTGDRYAEARIERGADAVTSTVDREPAESRAQATRSTPRDDPTSVGIEADTYGADTVPDDRLIDVTPVRTQEPDQESPKDGGDGNSGESGERNGDGGDRGGGNGDRGEDGGDDGDRGGDARDGGESSESDDNNGNGGEANGDNGNNGDGSGDNGNRDEDDRNGGDGDEDDDERDEDDDERDDEADGTNTTDGDSDASVTVETPDPTTRRVEVRSADTDGDTEVDLNGLRPGGTQVRLERLRFDRDAPGNVSFRVEGTTNPPNGTDPPPPGVDPLGYYVVSFAESDPSINGTTAEVVVDRDRLNETEADPERIPVYTEIDDSDNGDGDGSSWERTDTRVIDAGDEEIRIEARTGGSSAFAVATERPALDPREATLSAETVAIGEVLTVEVPLSNVGPAPANGEELRITTAEGTTAVTGGTFVVDTDAGGTATEPVTVRLEEPGRHELVVTGDALTESATVGTVVVEDPVDDGVGTDTGSADDDSGSGGETEDDEEGAVTMLSEFDLSDFAGLLALVAIVLATLFLVRRAPL